MISFFKSLSCLSGVILSATLFFHSEVLAGDCQRAMSGTHEKRAMSGTHENWDVSPIFEGPEQLLISLFDRAYAMSGNREGAVRYVNGDDQVRSRPGGSVLLNASLGPQLEILSWKRSDPNSPVLLKVPDIGQTALARGAGQTLLRVPSLGLVHFSEPAANYLVVRMPHYDDNLSGYRPYDGSDLEVPRRIPPTSHLSNREPYNLLVIDTKTGDLVGYRQNVYADDILVQETQEHLTVNAVLADASYNDLEFREISFEKDNLRPIDWSSSSGQSLSYLTNGELTLDTILSNRPARAVRILRSGHVVVFDDTHIRRFTTHGIELNSHPHKLGALGHSDNAQIMQLDDQHFVLVSLRHIGQEEDVFHGAAIYENGITNHGNLSVRKLGTAPLPPLDEGMYYGLLDMFFTGRPGVRPYEPTIGLTVSVGDRSARGPQNQYAYLSLGFVIEDGIIHFRE